MFNRNNTNSQWDTNNIRYSIQPPPISKHFLSHTETVVRAKTKLYTKTIASQVLLNSIIIETSHVSLPLWCANGYY